ncbi:MAG: hypothetical protein QOH64_458 [Acidimicrobiaceae bacterium]|jgi:uncharacterized membrane protein
MSDAPSPEGDASAQQHVLAVVFDKATRGDEALLTLIHLQQEGAIEIADAVVVAKTADGKTHIRQTVDPTPGRAAVSGAWLGTLVGLLFGGPLGGAVAGAAGAALYAKLVDIGLDDGWVKQMAEWLDPGTSALLLLLNDETLRDEAIKELQRFDGKLVTTTFPDSVRRALEEGLTQP